MKKNGETFEQFRRRFAPLKRRILFDFFGTDDPERVGEYAHEIDLGLWESWQKQKLPKLYAINRVRKYLYYEQGGVRMSGRRPRHDYACIDDHAEQLGREDRTEWRVAFWDTVDCVGRRLGGRARRVLTALCDQVPVQQIAHEEHVSACTIYLDIQRKIRPAMLAEGLSVGVLSEAG